MNSIGIGKWVWLGGIYILKQLSHVRLLEQGSQKVGVARCKLVPCDKSNEKACKLITEK